MGVNRFILAISLGVVFLTHAFGEPANCPAKIAQLLDGIDSQMERSAILRAMHDAKESGSHVSENIQNYRIKSEAARVEIAKIAAAQNGWKTSLYIQNYGIKSEAARVEIAKIAAAQDGWGTSDYIQNYGIESEAERVEIAKIAAAQNGEGTFGYIHKYNIKNSEAIAGLFKLAFLSDPEGMFKREAGKNNEVVIPFEAEEGVSFVSLIPRVLRENLTKTKVNIFTDSVKRASVGMGLVSLAAQKPEVAYSDSISLLSDGIGISLEAMRGESYSSQSVGDFYEILLELRRKLPEENLFAGLEVDAEVYRKKNFSQWVEILSLMRDLLDLRGKKSWPQILAMVNSHGKVSVVDLSEIEKNLLSAIEKEIRDLVKGKSVSLESLQDLLRNKSIKKALFTLLARYSGNSKWKEEVSELGKILAATVEKRFKAYKFLGTGGEEEKAAEQLKALETPEQKAEWQAQQVTMELYREGVSENGGSSENEIRDVVIRSVKGTIETNLIPHLQVSSIPGGLVEKVRESLEIKGDPLEKLRTLKERNRVEDAVLLRALAQIILDTKDFEQAKSYSRILKTWSQKMSLQSGDRAQIVSDCAEIDQKFSSIQKKRIAEALVVTISVNDALSLLTIGDCVKGVSSCQNYRTGSHIETLPGYVKDANVQALKSFVLEPHQFEVNDFEKVKSRLESKLPIAVAYDPESETLQFSWDNIAIKTKEIETSYRRQMVKLGAFKDGKPGLFLERAYEQTHTASRVMENQMRDLAGEWAKKLGGRLKNSNEGGPLRVEASRNSGGHYSDAAGGAKKGAYEIP